MSDQSHPLYNYEGTMQYLAGTLLRETPFNIGEWQSKDVSGSPLHATHELMDIIVKFDIPQTQPELAGVLAPFLNLDWAEEHFGERVGGVPVNPPPSHNRWPWSRHNGNHQNGEQQQFSHTYPERMWPRRAGAGQYSSMGVSRPDNHGIRFAYGDLQDVVDLLVRSPLTRQAYLPIWFPEDTGAAHRQRVPCTLGYHFLIRNGQLSCRYYMRSCDLVRHFTDDVYLAGRLMQWVTTQINEQTNGITYPVSREVAQDAGILTPGLLTMYISSLHAFTGDQWRLKQIAKKESAA